jgi:hypothetical protein
MTMLRRCRQGAAAWLTSLCLAIAACGSPNPLGVATGNMNSIIVGSADFPESKIVAEMQFRRCPLDGDERDAGAAACRSAQCTAADCGRTAPVVGALMVAALALILDAAWALLVWASVPGTGRLHRKPPNDDAAQRTPDKSGAAEQAARPPEPSHTVCM